MSSKSRIKQGNDNNIISATTTKTIDNITQINKCEDWQQWQNINRLVAFLVYTLELVHWSGLVQALFWAHRFLKGLQKAKILEGICLWESSGKQPSSWCPNWGSNAKISKSSAFLTLGSALLRGEGHLTLMVRIWRLCSWRDISEHCLSAALQKSQKHGETL